MNDSTQSNLSGEEWKTLRNLAHDRSIVVKGADKGSSVVVWDRDDYLQEASRQLWDTIIYEYVKFNENILSSLVERSNKIFNRWCSHKLISEKELKYFTYSFEKATNLGKLYFLPKTYKRLSSVPGRPVISNCATPSEKISKYLDHILKPAMQENWSYIKVGLSPFKKIFAICLIESPLEMIKNAFYFILKALFHIKIFKFLPRLFGHVGKGLIRKIRST